MSATGPAAEPASGPAPIDVAVNLLWCRPGAVGGSEEYLVRQLLGLAAAAPGSPGSRIAATVYCSPTFVDSHRELGDHFEMVAAPFDTDRRPLRVLGEHTWLAHHTRGAHVVHHGGGTTPMVGTRPIVLTVHDLQYRTHPEYLTALKRRYLERTIPRSVGRAAVVAVPTQYVRSTVVEAYGTDPDRV